MKPHRFHGAAVAVLLLACAVGISIAAYRAGPASVASPWPVDAVSVDPALTEHDTQALWESAREERPLHAWAGAASRPSRAR